MSELHAFVTAVRLGSFTRAAEQLCVTQGAISRAIGRLEAHFGQTLMTRDAHGLTLTQAGQLLLDATSAPLQAIEAISAELRVSARRDPAALSLAVIPTLASVWLMPRLPDFHRRHPRVKLSFAAYRRNEDFSGATPDAAILVGTPEQWPRWQCDYVVGKEVAVICHPDRLAARLEAGRWRDPAELLDEPLLYHANATENWAHWFGAVGIPATPRLANGFDQVSILVRAVMADIGIGVLQRCLIRDEIASGKICLPFDMPVSLPRGYFLCAPRSRCDHAALVAFRGWLMETAADDGNSSGNISG